MRKSLCGTVAVRRSNEIVETKRKVCIIVAEVSASVDKQCKLVNIIMHVIKRGILLVVIPLKYVRFGVVRNMCVVYLFDKGRAYASFKNMIFPGIAHIRRYRRRRFIAYNYVEKRTAAILET